MVLISLVSQILSVNIKLKNVSLDCIRDYGQSLPNQAKYNSLYGALEYICTGIHRDTVCSSCSDQGISYLMTVVPTRNTICPALKGIYGARGITLQRKYLVSVWGIQIQCFMSSNNKPITTR